HKLTLLRDKRTPTRDFKQLAAEIAMLMAYEVAKDLPLEAAELDTPLEHMRGVQVAGKKLTLVRTLRAGRGMADGIAHLTPSARPRVCRRCSPPTPTSPCTRPPSTGSSTTTATSSRAWATPETGCSARGELTVNVKLSDIDILRQYLIN